MSIPSSGSTPNYVSTTTPVQWMRAFAYAPDSARVRKNGNSRPELASQNRVPRCEDDDALPTQFHSCATSRTVSGVVNLRRDPVPGDTDSEVHLSGPSLTVPAKRKRQSVGRERESLSSPNIPEDISAIQTRESSANWRKSQTRSRTRCSSTSRGSVHDLGGGSNSYAPVRPTPSLRSRRVLLDAVEIVSKKRSKGRMDPETARAGCPTDSACKNPSSHYPSPPVSRGEGDVAVDDNNYRYRIPHAVSVEREERISPEPTLPLKTSKYFIPSSAPPTSSTSKSIPVLTPPSSPILTIPVYIESSDFEHPLLDASFGQPVDDVFDDLMIMLRRLKPILIQETVRDDPWKVLIAVRLLNVTTGKAAIPVFCKIISRWPMPQDLAHCPREELVELLRPLGLYNKRASWLKDMSGRFLEDRQAAPYCLGLPGVGPYALDSLCIFCASDKDAWKDVMPRDKELVRYLRWRWAVEEGKVWYPGTGVIGEVDVPYLIVLVDELAEHYDEAIGGEGYMYHFGNDL